MDVLDLFTAFPGRAFTMSEIMTATGINVASCHAVLSALAGRGYLARRGKAYTLGAALIAVGQAAAQTSPIIGRAQAAAHALNAELGTTVLLSTVAAGEILALTSLPDPSGRQAGIRMGQRVPLVPPAGVHFLAWASEEAITTWISRGETEDEAQIAAWRHELDLTRARGFQVTLRGETTEAFADMMGRMAGGTQPLAYKTEVPHLLTDHGWTLAQPETIDAHTLYDVALIAAPIFDRDGHAMLSLGLGGFAEPIDGARIEALAGRLMETCLRVMREERGA
jgi:DNA-binding IclR family transcriptional regulator